MSGKSKIHYWDSCIYIAWLNREEHEWMESVEEMLELNRQGKNRIITSTITFTEVMERIDSAREQCFHDLFYPHQHDYIDVDIRVAEKARDLRKDLSLHQPKLHFSVPDAIHLATSLMNDAVELNTNDDGKKPDELRRKTVSMLGLSDIELSGQKIKICRPQVVAQRSLFNLEKQFTQ